MNSSSVIIKTKIVNPSIDDFWKDISNLISGMTPKKVLVIVNDFADGNTEDVQLKKMLQACELTPENANIIKIMDGIKIAWHKLREALSPNFVFLIGVNSGRLSISALFRLNEPNKFDGCIWLPTIGVAELEKDKNFKNELWHKGMKPIFKDKKFGPI